MKEYLILCLKVSVQFSNGDEKTLFQFYPDEISFKESEFIGLTEESALRLKFEKKIFPILILELM